MRRLMMWAGALGVALVAGTAAFAQTPAPAAAQPSAGGTPDKMPFDIPYGTPINYDNAVKLLNAASAEARKHDWKMNIAVVDTHGELIAFARMDGAQVASVGVSQGKARTAARFRRETRVFYNAYETGHPYVATLDPTLVASPGGFPLVENGKLIGAIGCSGGTGDQDAATCKAGADLVK
jgi:glc operon protein GlcG